MLPRLEAQRKLDTINAMSIAMGGVSASERNRYTSRLELLANGGGQVAKATPATLAAMGVMVVEVPSDG